MSWFSSSFSIGSFKKAFDALNALPHTVATGSGDNQVSITRSQSNPGLYDVTIDGRTEQWTKARLEATTFDLGAGDDVLHAEGIDAKLKIKGGSGDDQITTGSADDDIEAGSGDDVVDAGAGNDRVSGGMGRDRLQGKSGDDTLYGGWGNDDIDGGSGDDRLYGGFGADRLEGGSGENTVQDNPLYWLWKKLPLPFGSQIMVADAQAQSPSAPTQSQA